MPRYYIGMHFPAYLSHGTAARYRIGCHCLLCRKAWAGYRADYRARKQTNGAHQETQQESARAMMDKESAQ